MTQDEISAVLADHALWSRGEGGKRANLIGANLADANLVGADVSGADLYSANLTGANLTGAIFTGAIFTGANLYSRTVQEHLRRAVRSDGYEFYLWHCEDGFYIMAGCRFFTLEEGRAHWAATRAGTSLGEETQDILDMFEKAIARAALGEKE